LRPFEPCRCLCPTHPALGTGEQDPAFEPTSRQLTPGERLILLTDGITGRHTEGGGTFGVDGLRDAIDGTPKPTAARTAMAIQQAVTDSWREPLKDDGTIVVMAVD
jgi:serine phosphatase RsbU (regulator of sigma subunit)